MQIIDNKALLLKLRNPKQVTTVIPKSKAVSDHEVLVNWGVQETHTLRGLNIKVPSPIEGRYVWTGKFAPMDLTLVDSATGAVVRRLSAMQSPLMYHQYSRRPPAPLPGTAGARLLTSQGKLYELPSLTAEPRLLLPLP